MARPCGCAGECGCTYLGVDGIRITGTGTTRDPGRIGLANPITGAGCDAIMSCVSTRLGPGLRYNATNRQIVAAISSDGGNTITYGTDSGLYSAGGGTGTDGGFATVAGLVARTTPFIGGSYGAGYSMHPEGRIDPYRIGMDMELSLVHVPVRRSREYFCVAQHHRNLGSYNYRTSQERTDLYDLAMAQDQWYIPAGDPSGDWQDPIYQPQAGYFGFNARDGRSMPLLSDVFGVVQRRVVLYLEVKDLGQSTNETPVPLHTYNPLDRLVRQYGMTKSVIVSSELPTTASTEDRTSILDGLRLLRDSGCAISAHLTTDAMVDANPPAQLVSDGFTWVAISYGIADRRPATVKAYKDAGLNVLLFTGARQWHWQLTNDTTKFGAGGLKGLLASDPVYSSGALNSYRYRQQVATWRWGTPDYGRHSNWSGTMEGQRDRYRGYVLRGNGDSICIDGDVLGPHDTSPSFMPSGYFILMGEQCPVPGDIGTGVHENYDIECGFTWDALITDRNRWMSIWFGNPQDRSLVEFTLANEFTRGYNFMLNQNGQFIMSRYDGIPATGEPPWQFSDTWDSPWRNNIQAGVEYRVKVRVRSGRIILGPADQAEGGPNTRVYDAATGGGDRWRGAYTYVGRHFFNTSDSTRVRFRLFSVVPAS